MAEPKCSCCGCWMDAPGVCAGCWAHQRDGLPCDQHTDLSAVSGDDPAATRRAMRDGGSVARVLTGAASYDEALDLVVELTNERMALRTYLYRMFAAVDDADERLMKLLAGRRDAWGLIDQVEEAKRAYTDYLTAWPDAVSAMEAVEYSEAVRRAHDDPIPAWHDDPVRERLGLSPIEPSCRTCGFDFAGAGLPHCTVCAGARRLLGADNNASTEADTDGNNGSRSPQ